MQRTVEKRRATASRHEGRREANSSPVTQPATVPVDAPSSSVPRRGLSSLLQAARSQLASIDDPSITAGALLGHVLGLTRAQVLARPEARLTAEQAAAFEALVARAAVGEPLAYLTG